MCKASRFTASQSLLTVHSLHRGTVAPCNSNSSSINRRFSSTEAAAPVNPRWLSELQARIKRCQSLDLAPRHAQGVNELARYVQSNWEKLLVGREGFLTGQDWRGLNRHEVAWGEMDSMGECLSIFVSAWKMKVFRSQNAGHVNNVVYNRYAESARVNWLRNHAAASKPEHRQDWADLMTPRNVGLIMRSIRTEYKFPMQYPDRVTVYHRLVSEPSYDSDHILLEAIILSERHQRPAARCFEDIVVYDYKAARKTPLKGFMVDELRAAYRAQQRSRQEHEEEAQRLVEEVEGLEASATA